MAKKKIIKNEYWESKSNGNRFVKICADMVESMAWQDLELESQGLYVFLKNKYRGNNADDIRIFDKDYRILRKSKNTIMKYLDKLIDNGFIKVVEHGRLARKPNIYGFSADWKKYNTNDFFIHPNNKRLTNIKKNR